MKTTSLNAGIVIVCAAALAGCSAQQAYYSAQGYERNRCERMLDQGERERCLASATTGYNDYRRQAEDTGRK